MSTSELKMPKELQAEMTLRHIPEGVIDQIEESCASVTVCFHSFLTFETKPITLSYACKTLGDRPFWSGICYLFQNPKENTVSKIVYSATGVVGEMLFTKNK